MLANLSPTQRADVLRKVETLSETDAKKYLLALRHESLDRCAKDGLFWLRFIHTRDEADPDNPIKPFPAYKPYVQWVWKDLDTHQRTVVAKSRQMLMSWILCAYAVWTAQFKPNSLVIFQTQKWDDA